MNYCYRVVQRYHYYRFSNFPASRNVYYTGQGLRNFSWKIFGFSGNIRPRSRFVKCFELSIVRVRRTVKADRYRLQNWSRTIHSAHRRTQNSSNILTTPYPSLHLALPPHKTVCQINRLRLWSNRLPPAVTLVYKSGSCHRGAVDSICACEFVLVQHYRFKTKKERATGPSTSAAGPWAALAIAMYTQSGPSQEHFRGG
jgi:hypothetical protein